MLTTQWIIPTVSKTARQRSANNYSRQSNQMIRPIDPLVRPARENARNAYANSEAKMEEAAFAKMIRIMNRHVRFDSGDAVSRFRPL